MIKPLLLGSTFVVVAAAHASVTLFTFNDPSPNETQPLFRFFSSGSTGSLTAGWGVAGFQPASSLNLVDSFTSTTYQARFDLTDLQGGALDATSTADPIVWDLEAGRLQFRRVSDDSLLAEIRFTGAQLENDGSLGGGVFAGNITGYSFGSGVAPGAIPESFAFNFTNYRAGDSGEEYTAAFTSSAVPEPGTLAALALGGLALAARRRKKTV